MKKFLLLGLVAFALSACENLQKEYPRVDCGATHIVKKETRKGIRYGVGCDTPKKSVKKALTPVVFVKYQPASIGMCTYFLFSEDGRTYYMFDNYGEDILSGSSDTKSIANFTPIVHDGKDHRLTEAEMYYRHIVKYDHQGEVRENAYYILPTTDGSVYGVICTSENMSVGPYKEIRFGLHGYMYKDIHTGKFGAKMVADMYPSTGYLKKNYTGAELERRMNLRTPIVFAPEYDEIIEVELHNKTSLWFARQGNKWYCKKAISDTEVKNVTVDQKLLARILKMPIRKEAKGTTHHDGVWGAVILAYGQRFGTPETSIAHL